MEPNITLNDMKISMKLSASNAVKFFKNRGVDISITGYKETAKLIKQNSWSVSGINKMNILQDTLNHIENTVKTGKIAFQDFAKNLPDYYKTSGWLPPPNKDGIYENKGKMAVIYYTNLSSAYNNGRFVQSQVNIKTIPYYEFRITKSNDNEEGCIYLNKKIFRKSDLDFIKNIRPPRHYNCHSKLVGRSESQVKGKKIWKGKYINREYWSWVEFRPKTMKGYDFKAEPKNYDKNIFKDYQNEINGV